MRGVAFRRGDATLPAMPRLRITRLAPALALAALVAVAGCSQQRLNAKTDRRRGERAYRAADYDRAAVLFQSSASADPRDYKSLFYLGATQEKRGDLQKAVASYANAYDVMPLTLDGRADDAFRYRVIDSLAAASARGPDAAGQLDRLERRADGSDSADDRFLLARAYAYAGDADSAIPAFARAAALAPDNFEIAKARGLYLEKLGLTDPARDALTNAYGINATDEEVNAALERLGVVPGPSLRPRDTLKKPLIPVGPIPRIPVG